MFVRAIASAVSRDRWAGASKFQAIAKKMTQTLGHTVIAHPSVRLYVCPSVTRVDQSKTVKVRVTRFFTTE